MENEIVGGIISSPITKSNEKKESEKSISNENPLMVLLKELNNEENETNESSKENEYYANCSFVFNLSNNYPLKFYKKYTKENFRKEHDKRLCEEESFKYLCEDIPILRFGTMDMFITVKDLYAMCYSSEYSLYDYYDHPNILLQNEHVVKTQLKRLVVFQLIEPLQQKIEKWTNMSYGDILFTSEQMNWSQTNSDFKNILLTHSNIVILCEDTNGTLFGGFIHSPIDTYFSVNETIGINGTNVKSEKSDISQQRISDGNAFIFISNDDKTIQKYDICDIPVHALAD